MKTYQDAIAKSQEIDSSLSTYDFRGDRLVYVLEKDGEGVFLVRSPVVLEYENWYLIFSEHHKPMIFAKDETDWVAIYKIDDKAIKKVSDYRPRKRRLTNG